MDRSFHYLESEMFQVGDSVRSTRDMRVWTLEWRRRNRTGLTIPGGSEGEVVDKDPSRAGEYTYSVRFGDVVIEGIKEWNLELISSVKED